MHYCGVIIKNKEISVVEARETFGEILVNRDVADWYSTGDYRERTFENGRVEITLEEFIEKNHYFNALPICFIDEEGYIFEQMITSEFYEYFDAPEERKELIDAQSRAYKVQLDKTLEKLSNIKDYNVCLIDYHN